MYATALVLALLAAQEAPDPDLAALRKQIVPPAEELKWLTIPWQITLWDAIIAAQKEDKPILFFAMNGHPLAVC